MQYTTALHLNSIFWLEPIVGIPSTFTEIPTKWCKYTIIATVPNYVQLRPLSGLFSVSISKWQTFGKEMLKFLNVKRSNGIPDKYC